MGYILRIGYKHIDTIRFQTILTLGCIFGSQRAFSVREWITRSAPQLCSACESLDHPNDMLSHCELSPRNYALTINSLLMAYEAENDDPDIRTYFRHAMKSSSMSDHALEDDEGTNLGGGWDPENFVIRGGIVMTLAALEEYERGVIRVLTAIPESNPVASASKSSFNPRLKEFRYESNEWKRLEQQKKIITAKGRSRIFERYGIVKPDTIWRTRLDLAWKDRNRFAHGYEAVEVSFGRFLEIYYDVFRAMLDLSKQCLQANRINI